MSKEELITNQSKLKAAIQNHQVVVVKLRANAKNEALLSELRAAQLEIQTLSEKQKHLVVELRKQLNAVANQKQMVPEERKPAVTSTPEHKLKHMHTPKPHTPHGYSVQKQHTSRPSIMQGSRTVLRLQNDLHVSMNVKSPPSESTDIRGLLKSSMQTQILSPKELQKVEYMASLSLVTRDRLKELEGRRRERRRRSTAVPQFSYVHGHLEPERKRPSSDVTGNERKRGRGVGDTGNILHSSTPVNGDVCTICKKHGDLVSCDQCSRAYHVTCISSAANTHTCPACQISDQINDENIENKQDQQPSILPQSHNALLTVMERQKEEERNELEEKSRRLRECGKQLQEQALRLGSIVQKKVNERKELQAAKEKAESRVKQLKAVVEQFKQS